MDQFLERINNALFKKRASQDLAKDELAEAQIELLKSESAVEFAAAMRDYNWKRVQRLQTHLGAGVGHILDTNSQQNHNLAH